MRFLNKFKPFGLKLKVEAICKLYGISNWTLNSNGSVDIHDELRIYYKSLSKLPLKFGKINGDFSCSYNNLISLEGAPYEVAGGFCCNDNKLITLEGAPLSVSEDFICKNNNLVSLEKGPQSVGRDFICSYNKLKSLKGCPQYVGRNFDCSSNQIRDFEGIVNIEGKFLCGGNPIYQIWSLFEDTSKIELLNDYDAIREDTIILDRLNDFLKIIGKSPVSAIAGYKCI